MKTRLIRRAFCLSALCLCTLSARASGPATDKTDAGTDLNTIATLDVPRYMGSWYEIAKFPNWFQRKCSSDTRADYSLQPEGKLQVTNRCKQANGEISEVIGAARQVGPANSPKLKVRFAPAWLSFIPAVWGNYWIIDLDADYQLAAISEPSRQYLWVLSRTPQVNQQAYAALLERLNKQGFDVRKLETTPQGGAQN
ncbi:lipocalin family protein [Uliginosibacterium flavum]|uniref:Outer membrane lipoprotein Blc n=1 Tax=Uliginosibacterium flavum TaxID=1396831 RepID=A0ABV2TQP4_9RHOO